MMSATRSIGAAAIAMLIVGGPSLATRRPTGRVLAAAYQAADPSLPDRLSDTEFWALVTDISEPGGFFRIVDNFTSNEPEVGRLFTMLREKGIAGGVYLGVGPEQNLTYIAAIRPAMAFVVDIRRQAVMQHLLFKAILELAADRTEFVSMLFSRKSPVLLDEGSSAQELFNVFAAAQPDQKFFESNLQRIKAQLHLSAEDEKTF